MGPGYPGHGGMARGVRVFVLTDYAINWLAQHGEMPTGVHKAPAVRRHPMIYATSLPVLTFM